MSKGEFNSVAQVNGGLENMINWDGKDKDLLALIKYIADEDKLEKVGVMRMKQKKKLWLIVAVNKECPTIRGLWERQKCFELLL